MEEFIIKFGNKSKNTWIVIGVLIVVILLVVEIFIDFTNGFSWFGWFHIFHNAYYYLWHKEFLISHFFVDSHGKFNWIGITSVLAIATLTFNAWDRRRQFKADLVSKSRITWIENVRKTMGQFLGTAYDANDKFMQLRADYSKVALLRDYSKMDEKVLREAVSSSNHFEELTETLKLYFSDKDSDNQNGEVLKHIDAIYSEFSNTYTALLKYVNDDKLFDEKDSQKIIDKIITFNLESSQWHLNIVTTTREISDYLKHEWDRAKSGN